MLQWFKQLDEILRGDATRMSSLTDGRIKTPIGGLSIAIILLAGSFDRLLAALKWRRSSFARTLGATHT